MEVHRRAHASGACAAASGQRYTAGVICAKVARYAERIHHPDRLLYPHAAHRAEGLGRVRAHLLGRGARHRRREVPRGRGRGTAREAVWPYYYAGTMGLVMRDGINRLRHVKKYSGLHSTICVNPAWTGYIAGTGTSRAVPDPREMAKSDCVVIWGTNPVQHAGQRDDPRDARPQGTRRQDRRGRHLSERHAWSRRTSPCWCGRAPTARSPARSCTCLFRDGLADWDYLDTLHRRAARTRSAPARPATPEWASQITGCPVETSRPSPRLVGTTKRTYFRLGYGFGRSRNGATNMHAASCIRGGDAARGRYEGGGAFHNNGAIYHWNKAHHRRASTPSTPSIRLLDQSRIGRILIGDKEALDQGPSGHGAVHPEHQPGVGRARAGQGEGGASRARTCSSAVHEQFMTETALMADVVMPATMFMEHDDVYAGRRPPVHPDRAEADRPAGRMLRATIRFSVALAKRLGAHHPGFEMTPRELIDRLLKDSGWDGGVADARRPPLDRRAAALRHRALSSRALRGRTANSASSRTGATVPFRSPSLMGPVDDMPALPDHWEVIEEATPEYPFRLATSPARNFLNSTFNETPTSIKREHRPTVMIHPEDAAKHEHRRRRQGDARLIARRGAPAREALRRRAPRRADRGVDLAERGLRGRRRGSIR